MPSSDAITLREYLEARIEAQREAVDLARRSMEHRLEVMNEFRESLKDQASTFVSRAEMTAKIDALEKGRRDLMATGIAIVGCLLGIASMIVNLLRGA